MGVALLTPPIALAATLAIAAEYRGPRRLHYACKPLATALILALALATGRDDPAYTALIALGLACSLAGDICLMLPQDRFIAGLISFLLAHLAYSAAFVRADGAWDGTSVWLAIPLLAYGLAVFLALRPHLGPLTVPVLLYMLVILAMAWCAIAYARREPARGSLAVAGALLFVCSDSTLAINRFARPFRAAPAVVLGTYYAAQWLIARS